MNGQQFHFHGYLSPKKSQLTNDLKRLEELVRRDQATQIFIETPYRNGQVVDMAIQVLSSETTFCIAVDLTTETEWIKTMRVIDWKKMTIPELHKRPAVFLIGTVSG